MICLFTSEHLFSPLMGHFQTTSKKKRGSLWEKLGLFDFPGKLIGILLSSIILPISLFYIYKKGFFPLECFLEGNLPCFVPFFNWNEVVGGILFKSHSGKWILEWVLVFREQDSLLSCLSVAVSLLQRSHWSSLSFPSVFWAREEFFLRHSS